MLTIIIPSYNHDRYILECMDAATRVEVKDKKIIVVDDGSTDRTIEVVNRFIKDKSLGSEIVLIKKRNSGLVSSLNLALSRVETEFVYIVASDDVLVPEGVFELFVKMLEDSNLAFIIGGGYSFFEDGSSSKIYKEKHSAFFDLSVDDRNRAVFLDYPGSILLQSTIFRASALRMVGCWDTVLELDDYPMFIKLLARYQKKGKDFEFLPSLDVVAYRQHGVNSYKNTGRQFRLVAEVLDHLAPDALKYRAIGRASAYYSLVALRGLRLDMVVKIISLAHVKSWGWLVVNIIPFAFKKYQEKYRQGMLGKKQT